MAETRKVRTLLVAKPRVGSFVVHDRLLRSMGNDSPQCKVSRLEVSYSNVEGGHETR